MPPQTATVLSSEEKLPARDTPATSDARATIARRIFRGAFLFNTALTLFWLASWATDSRFFFADYRITTRALINVTVTVVGFAIIPGLFWWGVKSAMLRWVGFDRVERRDAFSSRMDRPYDVADLTGKYSERKIRIADMVGRRGRFGLLSLAGLYIVYAEVVRNPQPDFATNFGVSNLFEGVLTSWIFLGTFYLNGAVGAAFYGPQSRVMDGYLGRANCLLITTLWTAFKFIMVPLNIQLAAVYPREQFPVVFGFIWLSYITADSCAEVFGSLFGRQSIKVWGVGDINRKSVVGVVAGFAGAMSVNVALISASGLLVGPWIALAVVGALSSSIVELYSPRGTDDFTMATTNAILCLAFGAWVL
jgi:hypothetical protein